MPDRDLRRRRVVAEVARPGGQDRIDTAGHVASVSWLAALANPPPAPPLQGGESSGEGPQREEFRAPAGVRKSPRHEPAGPVRWLWGFRFPVGLGVLAVAGETRAD